MIFSHEELAANSTNDCKIIAPHDVKSYSITNNVSLDWLGNCCTNDSKKKKIYNEQRASPRRLRSTGSRTTSKQTVEEIPTCKLEQLAGAPSTGSFKPIAQVHGGTRGWASEEEAWKANTRADSRGTHRDFRRRKPPLPSRGLLAGWLHTRGDTTHVWHTGRHTPPVRKYQAGTTGEGATYCSFASRNVAGRPKKKKKKKRKRAKTKKKKNGERAGGRASRADRARGRAYVRRKNEENGRRATRPPAQGRRRSQLRAKRHAGASLFRDTSDHAHRFENRHESFLRDPAVSTARILFEQRTNLRNLFVNNE